jgi:hypothetical protein
MNDAKNKDNYNQLLEILTTLIHDVWAMKLGNEMAIVNLDISRQIEKLSERIESKRLAAWLTEIEKMRESFNVNINRKIATDALFMQMVSRNSLINSI